MILAQLKRKENIAEYLLYMWQIEDLIRAYSLDIDKIDENLISKYNVDDTQRQEIKDWYESLIKMMELEDKKQMGHLQINKNVIIRLADLHNELLKSPKFPEYGAEFYKTLPYIVELRAKSGENKVGELETCFNALYGILMIKLQGKEISEDTVKAIAQISKFLATLSAFYHKNEERPIFEDNEDNI
jgi:hypothetical protein